MHSDTIPYNAAMQLNTTTTAPVSATDELTLNPRRQKCLYLQALVFLLIWPSVNTLFSTMAMHNLGVLNHTAIIAAALKAWVIFGLAYLLIRLAETRLGPFGQLFSSTYFWPKFAAHFVLVAALTSLFFPLVETPSYIKLEARLISASLLLTLEIGIYVATLHMFEKQEQVLALALNIQQTELNAIRAQSNPHFLFNTLNLIAAEITHDPENAREIVYDLADLLRLTVKMAQNSLTSLQSELAIIELYLNLQQKRFPDRLSYHLEVQPSCQHLTVPSLLLLPIIENAIKHAVSPYATKAHITVSVALNSEKRWGKAYRETLQIAIKDSGPLFDPHIIKPGNGLRILQQTLQTHYQHDYQMRLDSSAEGGCLSLSLPVRRPRTEHTTRPNNKSNHDH